MEKTKQHYQHAELAQAAYGTFSPVGTIDLGALTHENVGMPESQATEFSATWKVVDQYTAPSTDGNAGSGFSATMFQNISTGKYVFAVRGTEPGEKNDGEADLFGIEGTDFALRQVVDLYNYRKNLEVPAGQAYQAAYLQLDDVKTAGLVATALGDGYPAYRLQLEKAGYWVEGTNVYTLAIGASTDVATSGLETGRLSTTLDFSDGYDVVGHSLGGHLSLVLGRLDSNNVENVTTFNPLYFDTAVFSPYFIHQPSERFFQQLSQLESAVYGSGDIANKIGTNQPKVSYIIFSEGDSASTPVGAHSMIPITDMLSAELSGPASSCPHSKPGQA
ncbi:MAG: hypothetical protein LBL72_01215 [Candidatus Accumulibacter sp.]|jgi:hypothetical protein|nr:hypothetical protein [Accumulibacter sp.]